LSAVQSTGLPIAEGLDSALDLPHTITYAITYREQINSFRENLPKEKQPPRNLWDKPHRLSEFLEDVFKSDSPKDKYIEYNEEDVE
jgi:hypothetical protein